LAQLGREVLFANEAFVVGMLQAVSGGSIVAALAQAESLVKWAGRTSFLLFVTAATLALGLAILAAYWRHQYKMWDVKANASKATFYLHGMRRVVVAAMFCILFALGQFIVFLWLYAFKAIR
jgi:hypothetical protein